MAARGAGRPRADIVTETALPPPPSLHDARRAASLLLLSALLHGCSRHVPEAPPPTPAPAAPPADVPSDLAGVWTSTRGPVMRCIELHADGTYTIEADQSQTRFDRIAGAGSTCPSQ